MQRSWLVVAAGTLLAVTVCADVVLTTGNVVPDFTLTDVRGQSHTLSRHRGQVVLLDFWSATCPVSARYEDRLTAIATEYAAKGVVTLGIDANATENAALIQRVIAERGVPFPILIDPGNMVADLYGGLTTPHVFVVDTQGRLVYQGAIDDEGLMGRGKISRQYLREALDAVSAGRPVQTAETEPVGCSIKRVAR